MLQKRSKYYKEHQYTRVVSIIPEHQINICGNYCKYYDIDQTCVYPIICRSAHSEESYKDRKIHYIPV